jgi:hypothetical protein
MTGADPASETKYNSNILKMMDKVKSNNIIMKNKPPSETFGASVSKQSSKKSTIVKKVTIIVYFYVYTIHT